MKGEKYILTAKSKNVAVELQYDLNGLLIEWKIIGDINKAQHQWLINRVPIYTADIAKSYKSQKFEIKKIPTDLSFERIWNEYGLKRKKQLALKKWQKMTEAQKVKALLHIPKYNNELKLSGTAKAHLLTYLNQEYYNDKD